MKNKIIKYVASFVKTYGVNIVKKYIKKHLLKRKKYSNKICKHTRKSSIRRSVILSCVLSITVCLIVFVFIFSPLMKSVISAEFENKEKTHSLLATHYYFASKIKYEELFSKIKKIEYGANQVRKMYGISLPRWKRCSVSELQAYSSLIFYFSYRHKLQPEEFAAITSAENYWDKVRRSRAGAVGLNQVMPDTFDLIWRRALHNYKKPNRYTRVNVFNNTEVGLHYYTDCRNQLKSLLKRKPTVREVAMCYNGGFNRISKALIAYGLKKEYYPRESWYYGMKVEFYYKSYKKNKFFVLWDERKHRGIVK